MMFDFTIHCFIANILFGIAACHYGFKSKGMPGVFYVLISLGASALWTLAGAGIFSCLPFRETLCGSVLFFVWNLAALFPWGLLCRSRYKSSEPWFFWIGAAGVLAYAAFLAGVACLVAGENSWQGLNDCNIDNIFRFCGLVLLLSVPALMFTAVSLSIQKEGQKSAKPSLPFAAWGSSLLFFLIGMGALGLASAGV